MTWPSAFFYSILVLGAVVAQVMAVALWGTIRLRMAAAKRPITVSINGFELADVRALERALEGALERASVDTDERAPDAN
ncbi:MAG: hypothetical protein QOG85_4 [Gaiellaceae bacterium]|nr:hypothetical protein [Gaiellaceae bacterium]